MFHNLKSVNIKNISEGLMSFFGIYSEQTRRKAEFFQPFMQVTKRTEKIKITRLSDYKKEDR